MTQPSQVNALERTLSPGRLAPYVTASGGSLDRGIALYRWNIEASAAAYEVLHVVEVALRNALHAQLTALHKAKGGVGTWLNNPPETLNLESLRCIDEAKKNATKSVNRTRSKGARPLEPTTGHVVAELTFGFWRFLLTDAHTDDLWVPALHLAFPLLLEKELTFVGRPVARLAHFRNRIAHLEPIHYENLAAKWTDAKNILGFICDDTKEWVKKSARLEAVIAEKPRLAPGGRPGRPGPAVKS